MQLNINIKTIYIAYDIYTIYDIRYTIYLWNQLNERRLIVSSIFVRLGVQVRSTYSCSIQFEFEFLNGLSGIMAMMCWRVVSITQNSMTSWRRVESSQAVYGAEQSKGEVSAVTQWVKKNGMGGRGRGEGTRKIVKHMDAVRT